MLGGVQNGAKGSVDGAEEDADDCWPGGGW